MVGVDCGAMSPMVWLAVADEVAWVDDEAIILGRLELRYYIRFMVEWITKVVEIVVEGKNGSGGDRHDRISMTIRL